MINLNGEICFRKVSLLLKSFNFALTIFCVMHHIFNFIIVIRYWILDGELSFEVGNRAEIILHYFLPLIGCCLSVCMRHRCNVEWIRKAIMLFSMFPADMITSNLYLCIDLSYRVLSEPKI